MRIPLIPILCMFIILLANNYAMEYKWSSSIPIDYVPLSTINNENQLNKYLNNDNIVIFYIDKDYNLKRDDWILYKLNITRVVPKEIPNYYNYTYISTENSIVIYSKNSLYRDNDGTIVYNPPVSVNYSEYEIRHVPPQYREIVDRLPKYDGYAVINNGTFILYPKKYITKIEDGTITYHPPLNLSNINVKTETVYGEGSQYNVIPEYYNYTFISKGVITIYPKKYVIRDDEENIIIFNPPVDIGSNDPPVYNISTKLLDPEKGIYEIKPKKVLITNHINPDDKDILDFVGYYVSENNGTFAYINKVPPRYKNTIATGIVIQKAIFDQDGEYVVDIAGRK